MSRLLMELLEEKAEELKSENKNLSGEELKELILSFDQNRCIEYDKLNSNERIKEKEIEQSYKLRNWEVRSNRRFTYDQATFHSVIATATLTLKTALTINAGAATAFLSFIGYLWVRLPNTEKIPLLAEPLIYFGYGTLWAAIGTGATYVTQSMYLQNKSMKWGNRCKLFAISLIIVSYIDFGIGLLKSNDIFVNINNAPATSSSEKIIMDNMG